MQSNGHRIHFLHAVVIRTIYGNGEWLNLHSIYKGFLEVRCQRPINQAGGLGAGCCILPGYVTIREDVPQQWGKLVREGEGNVVLDKSVGDFDFCSSSLTINITIVNITYTSFTMYINAYLAIPFAWYC